MPGDTWQNSLTCVHIIAICGLPRQKIYSLWEWNLPKVEWNYEESLTGSCLMKNIDGGWYKGVLKLSVKDLNQFDQKSIALESSTTPQRVSIGLSLMMRNLCSLSNVAVQTENLLLSSVLYFRARHDYRHRREYCRYEYEEIF